MPRDVSLSDSKCLSGGHEWVNAQGGGCLQTFRETLYTGGRLSANIQGNIHRGLAVFKHLLKTLYTGGGCLQTFIGNIIHK